MPLNTFIRYVYPCSGITFDNLFLRYPLTTFAVWSLYGEQGGGLIGSIVHPIVSLLNPYHLTIPRVYFTLFQFSALRQRIKYVTWIAVLRLNFHISRGNLIYFSYTLMYDRPVR